MSEKMKILIAYDGSACADNAMEDMQRAGLPAEAEAWVISVEEEWLAAPPMSSYEMVGKMVLPGGATGAQMAPEAGFKETASAAYQLALKARAKIQEWFPAWDVNHKSPIGSP